MDLPASGQRVGCLLNSRVTDVNEFVDTLDRIMRGGSVVDSSLAHERRRAQRKNDPLGTLSARECEVLALMAEGRSNSRIARALWVSEGAAERHVHHILTKLRLPDSGDEHRVLAVVTSWKLASARLFSRRAAPGSLRPTGMTSAGTRVPDSR